MTRTRLTKWLSSLPLWQQIAFIIGSYVVVTTFGSLLIAPTGPGSDRVLYVTLLGYSCFLVLLGSRVAKIVGLVLAIGSLVGVVVSTQAKLGFIRNMERRKHRQVLASDEPGRTGATDSPEESENRKADGDAKIISTPGAFVISRLSYMIDVRVSPEGIVHYQVTDSSGHSILASTERFSDYQRWCLFWDANDCLWVESSDIGGFLWQRTAEGVYKQSPIATNAALYARMPQPLFDQLPTSVQKEYRAARTAQ